MALTETERLKGVEDAIEEVDYWFHILSHARNLFDQGAALVELSNKLSDLKSWHSGLDDRTGMLPWEREAEE